jgi:hypothetical protein
MDAGNTFEILQYFITPVLQRLRDMVFYGGQSKPGPPSGL